MQNKLMDVEWRQIDENITEITSKLRNMNEERECLGLCVQADIEPR